MLVFYLKTSSETGRSSCNDVTTERRKEDGGKFGRELMMATRDVVESEDLVEVLEECVEAILTHSTGLLMGSLSSASCQKRWEGTSGRFIYVIGEYIVLVI